MKKNVFLTALVWVLSLFLFASFPEASTVTQTLTKLSPDTFCLTFAWAISADDVTTGDNFSEESDYAIDGQILCVVTNPASTPTDDYDLTLTNSDGADVMGGGLANRDTANSEIAYPQHLIGAAYYVVVPYVEGLLTLNMAANNQASSTGTVKVYYKRP